MLSFLSAAFFKVNFFREFFQEHYQSVNSLGPYQDRRTFCRSFCVKTVCKGYRQVPKVAASKEIVNSYLQLIEFLFRSRILEFKIHVILPKYVKNYSKYGNVRANIHNSTPSH